MTIVFNKRIYTAIARDGEKCIGPYSWVRFFLRGFRYSPGEIKMYLRAAKEYGIVEFDEGDR